MATGLKVTEEVYQEIVRRRREAHLGAETIGKQLGLAKATVQKAFARMDAEAAATNGQGPAPITEDVPLDQIDLGVDTQARVTINGHIVHEYAEARTAGAHFPPVVLFRDAEGYWVGDGHHRCRAAQQVGDTTIKAEVREGGWREAFLYACEANLIHGLRPDALDKRHALRRLLMDETWATWSDRELGRRCGLDHKTVAKYRPGVTGEIPSERTYTTKHGTVATMDTTRIGTRAETPAPANGASAAKAVQGTAAPPTRTEGHWSDPLASAQSHLGLALQGFESFGGLAAVLGRWSPEQRQAFHRRVTYVDTLWQQFLRDYRDLPEAVRLGEAEDRPDA